MLENVYEMIARQMAVQNRIVILRDLVKTQQIEPEQYANELFTTLGIVDEDINTMIGGMSNER